ncbi:Oxidoreductase boa17 [Madurella fahalii]|uniref:Oxidoreductase boa17 n=1 Tax=Madurella fahalii TaxID=1157608 RepID=A0ABQ0G4L8_9PEZI
MTKVWFVTGSSRGLGRAIVEAALDSGASVIATARAVESLNAFTEKFGADRFLPLPVDVTKENDVIRAVNAGHEKFGRIDVVVNNAGYANTAAVEDMDIQDFREQMETNFMGVVYVTKAVLPILRKQGAGHIFQVSSLGGRIGTPGVSAYQSAKWAVGGFSTVLAQEVAPLGIKVTVLEPGGIRTDWAGPSMKIHPISEPYKPTVGAIAEMLKQLSGNELSLPGKIARIIVDLSEAEDVPLRLLLGPEAVDYAAKAAEALAESDRKWRDVSLSSA